MTISFVGHGYVGLVTACVFADFGNHVWVIGHTPEKLARLSNGDPLIYEPGLQEMLQKNLKAKRIHFTDSYAQAISESEIVFIAVGTPPKESGEADLSTVFQVAEQVGKHLNPEQFTVVSCKSTVPVGTNLEVEKVIHRVKPTQAQFAVASCPEFLREGTGIYDTLNPDRIVIGTSSQPAVNLLLDLHKPLPGKRVITDLASAEIIKYASNSMLATKISFANLISLYCEKTSANVETVMDAVGFDKRIGRMFLYPGIGYGGSCFPKDVKALISTGQQLNLDTSLLESVETINEQVRENFLQKIEKYVKGKKLAFWGLSFKPDTDDIRFAPSIYLIEQLLNKGYTIQAFDPAGMPNVQKKFKDKITYMENPFQAVDGADGLCILTEWNDFKQADLKKVKALLRSPVVIDGRNMYQLESMQQLGFTYISTGRPAVQPSV